MIDIICDKCKGTARLNNNLTTKDYINVVELIINSDGELTNIPNYIYYSCADCKTSFKYSIEEILNKVKEKIAKDAIYMRYEDNHRSFYGHKIEQDSGLVYCGGCYGIDGKGNCFKDSYNLCRMRR